MQLYNSSYLNDDFCWALGPQVC